MAGRVITFVYGVISYLVFLGIALYMIGFTGGIGVPKTVDSLPYADSVLLGVIINLLLIALFGMQHSVMARPTFKEKWTQIVPQPAERSTFVLLASLLLIFLVLLWQPIPGVIWDARGTFLEIPLWVIFGLGWAMVIASTFAINHFDLLGLRQVYFHLTQKPYTPVEFKMNIFYRYVRHPLMLSFLIAFWVTPFMTWSHLLLAGGFSIYIFVGIAYEERDLIKHFGETYESYREQVSMIVPMPRKGHDK